MKNCESKARSKISHSEHRAHGEFCLKSIFFSSIKILDLKIKNLINNKYLCALLSSVRKNFSLRRLHKNLRASALNFCLIFLTVSFVFAKENQNDFPFQNQQAENPELLEIQSEIDSAALLRSPEEISEILVNHKNNENYPEIENLVLEKVQNLVTNEDFELARDFSMCVIENNISNFEAIDLYSYIEKILANERTYQRNRELHRYSNRREN